MEKKKSQSYWEKKTGNEHILSELNPESKDDYNLCGLTSNIEKNEMDDFSSELCKDFLYNSLGS